MVNEEKKKKHYSWWPVVRDAVRAYPGRKGLELSGVALHEQQAVQAAIEVTERMRDAAMRLKIIQLVHFDGTHTLEGAGMVVHCSRSWVGKLQRDFFEEVARNRDLLD